MAVITTRRVLEHPPIPPGGKLRFGQVIGPPVDTANGAVVNPISARSKAGLPMEAAAPVRTAIITEVDTKTGERRMRQERIVDDLPRIQGETNASYTARNQDHHKAQQEENKRRLEHRQKMLKLQQEETSRSLDAEAELEAKRMEAHDKALDETQQRVDAQADQAQQEADDAAADAGTTVERVQTHRLPPGLAQASGIDQTRTQVTGIRSGSLDDGKDETEAGATGPTGGFQMGVTGATGATGATGPTGV